MKAPAKKLAFLLPDMTGGGAERVALHLMADFLRAGHEVDLLLTKAIGELMPLIPPEVRVIDLKAERLRSALRPLIRYLKESRPDALQVSMWPLTIVGIIAARLSRTGTRVVVSDHIALSRQYGSGLIFRVMRWTIRLFYPRADARVIVSRQAAEDLSRFSGLDPASIDVIYNPVAAPPHPPATTQHIEQLWPPGTARILTVGRLKAQKNHRLLIRAFKRVAAERPAALMILGDGPLRDELRQAVRDAGLEDLILFPGFTTDPWPYYASADLFVLSSDYEGFGNVLLEAMHCGLPVVSTDCESGPREILDDGRYGALVPVGDEEALARAIEQSLSHPPSPGAVRARAEALSGLGASARYLALMLGEA